MKPQELFLASGKSAGVWYCDSCHLVKRTEQEAEDCCRPRHCDSCGCEVEKYQVKCSECHWQMIRDREQAQLDDAELVERWDDWVWHPALTSHRDGYFPSTDDLVDWCDMEGVPIPEFAFCCKPRQLWAAMEDLLHQLDSEGWEDMTESAAGLDQLEKAIDEFNELNKDTFTVWEADYKRKVRL